MTIKNTTTHYGFLTIFLHWIMAILLIGLFSAGLYMTGLDYYDPMYHSLPQLHKSFGLLTLLFLLIRYVWRLHNIIPCASNTLHRHDELLARFIHNLFYIVILCICISGYLISTAKGKSIEFFGAINIAVITRDIDESIEEFIGETHFSLAILLSALVLMHVLAALKHHFIDKDNTLKRMIKLNFGEN